jgi:hypothetical protein
MRLEHWAFVLALITFLSIGVFGLVWFYRDDTHGSAFVASFFFVVFVVVPVSFL